MVRIYLVCYLIFFLRLAHSQELKIDHDFGEDGITGYTLANSYLQGYKVVRTTDGSYLTINYLYDFSTDASGFSLVRILNNGSVDHSFADNGHFVYYTEHTEYPADFVVLLDDKIAMAFSDNTGKIDLVILNKDGSVNTNSNLSPFPNHYLIPIRLLYKDGHIFIGGIYNSKNLDLELMYILKISPDGKPDESFAEKGIFFSEKILELNARFQDMAIQDDKIVIFAAGNEDLIGYNFLYRIGPDGTGDLNFAEGGILFIKNDFNEGFGTIKTDSAGNIYIVPFDYPAVLKISREGKPVQDFGIKGLAIDNFFIDMIAGSFFSILQKDGSTLIFGDFYKDHDILTPVIFKYDSTGTRDQSFGINGIFSEYSQINGSYINACSDKNDKLVIIGTYSDPVTNVQNSFLTRYELIYTGIEENNNDPQVLIYPNPASDIITIEFGTSLENTDIVLSDIQGRIIKSLKRSNFKESIDVSSLENGIYLLRIESASGFSVEKIIKADK
jgi:hypothetical protein